MSSAPSFNHYKSECKHRKTWKAGGMRSYCIVNCGLMKTLFFLLLGLLFPSFLLGASHDTVIKSRPRIGLALGGGGALGFAHIGVLKVLEEMQIPVDYIAGTSMGAIIAGLYASGMSPDEMQRTLSGINWWEILKDETPRKDLNFRRKRDDERYIGFQMGIKGSGIRLPAATSAGQKLTNLLQTLTLSVSQIEDFNGLNIPYRAVATDIGNGEAVILSRGNLATAMRASMAVPGFFSPVELDGRLLVDGGLVNNLPVDVVRDMGADVVIAVDLSQGDVSPGSKDPETLLEILGRTYAVMRQPVNVQQAAMADLVIAPALGAYSAASFHLADGIIPLGQKSAEGQHKLLEAYQVGDEDYRLFLGRQRGETGVGDETIAAIRITGNDLVDTRIIQDQIRCRADEQLDLNKIEADVKRIYGLGDFEQVLFRLHRTNEDRYEIEYLVKEKAWGPLFLNFGLRLESDDERDTSWQLLLNLTRTHLNGLGGEWVTDFKAGDVMGIFSEWYQPLRTDRMLFIAPSLEIEDQTLDFYVEEQRVAEYEVNQYAFNLDIGSQFRNYGEARLGILLGYLDAEAKVGTSDLPTVTEDLRAFTGSVILDRLDRSTFPRKGYYFDLQGRLYGKFLGGRQRYEKAWAFAETFKTYGRHTFTAKIKVGTSFNSDIPLWDQYRLGGFPSAERDRLPFAGLASGQVYGPYAGVMTMGYRHRLFKLSPGVGEDVYLILNGDAGNAWNDTQDIALDDLRLGGLVALAAETLFGPLSVGYGMADEGDYRFNISLGSVF